MTEQIFLKVLNMSFSASVLVAVVLVLRLVLKKAPKWINVLLWGMVALRLLCPFTPESSLSLSPKPEIVTQELLLSRAPAIDSGIPAVDSLVNPILTEQFTPDPSVSANPLQILIGVSAYLWVLGMTLMGLYTLISYWRIHRRVATAVRIRENIFESEAVGSPFVLGLIKPRIYLPLHIRDADAEHVIAHERTHIRRKDHWWKPLGFLLLAASEYLPGGAGCPFGNLLTLELESGETLTLSMAADSCAAWLSNGVYYDFGSGNEEFYALFFSPVIHALAKDGWDAVGGLLTYLDWADYIAAWGQEDTFALMDLIGGHALENPDLGNLGAAMNLGLGTDGACTEYYAQILNRLYEANPKDFAWACLGNATEEVKENTRNLLAYSRSLTIAETQALLEDQLPNP